jgi:hypothetical protein
MSTETPLFWIGVILLAIFVIYIFFLFYFLPYKIAKQRDARNTSLILLFNILLGMTLFGWFVVFLWALLDESESVQQRSRKEPF